MPDQSEDVSLRINVLNPQGQRLGGKVDIACKLPDGSGAVDIAGGDASNEIDVSGLQRGGTEPYEVTVTQTGTNLAATQQVRIPATGAVVVQAVLGAPQVSAAQVSAALAGATQTGAAAASAAGASSATLNPPRARCESPTAH